MNIYLATNGNVGPRPLQSAGRAQADSSDRASFASAEGLDRAAASQPEARAEAVAKAAKLMAEDNYPPEAVISGISRLLGTHWESNQ